MNKLYLFIYGISNIYIAMKLCISHFEYLKYLYEKIEIFIIIFYISV